MQSRGLPIAAKLFAARALKEAVPPGRNDMMRMAAGLLMAVLAAATTPAIAFPVTVTLDAGKSVGKLPPIWRFFGADEPNYATQPDGAKLLTELGALRSG